MFLVLGMGIGEGILTTMSSMFAFASSFNQPLNNWNVSNVIDMTWMFCEASSFNQPLNYWYIRSEIR